jgi:hypothetical protein
MLGPPRADAPARRPVFLVAMASGLTLVTVGIARLEPGSFLGTKPDGQVPTPSIGLGVGSAGLTWSVGNFTDYQVDHLSVPGSSLNATSARIHLGVGRPSSPASWAPTRASSRRRNRASRLAR